MKVGPHQVRLCDPDVIGQDRVQRAPQLYGIPFIWHGHTGCLSQRVYARVGPTGSQYGDMHLTEPRESFLQYCLNGSCLALTLPSCEARTVVLQNELHVS